MVMLVTGMNDNVMVVLGFLVGDVVTLVTDVNAVPWWCLAFVIVDMTMLVLGEITKSMRPTK
jgi:hypothetical protein